MVRSSLKARRRLLVEALEGRALLAADLVLGSPEDFDIFLKIEGIPGDSPDVDHKGEIEVESFSWGASNAGSLTRPGKTTAEDFHFLTPVSKASPLLLAAAASGKHISKAELFIRKAGDTPTDYLKIKLEDILISSIRSQGLNEQTPEEEITLSFAKISESLPLPPTGGAPGAWSTTSWTVDRNSSSAPGASLLDDHKFSPNTAAPVEMFLKIEGIPGESIDKVQKGSHEILSYSWGLSQSSGRRTSGGGASSGALSMQDFHFVLPVDGASDELAAAVASGKHFPTASLVVRNPGDAGSFLKYQLKDVLITSYREQGTNDGQPLDEFTLNFTSLSEAYLDDDGTLDQIPAPVTGGWSNSLRRATYKLGDSILDRTEAPPLDAAYYIKFDGVDGESKDTDHKGSIEIDSYSWGLSRPTTSRSSNGGASGAIILEDLHVAGGVDAASPVLLQSLATGKHIAKAVLHVRKSGGDQSDYHKVELSDVLVSSVRVRSVNGEEPVEEVTLNFASLTDSFTAPDGQGGLATTTTKLVRSSGRSKAQYALGPNVLEKTHSASNSVAAYIKFDGVDGESTSSDHKGEIEIQSFSWGVQRTDLASSGASARSKPQVSVDPLQVVASLDKATPILFTNVVTGKHIPSAVLSIDHKGDSNPETFLKYELKDVMVSSFQARGDQGSAPQESLSLNFTAVAEKYSPTVPNVGTARVAAVASAPIQGGFDGRGTTVRFTPTDSSLLDLTKAPTSSAAAYIKFDGVDGESNDQDHKGWIDVLSFSWGVSQSGGSIRSSGGGGGAGKVQMQDFHFVAPVNVASSALVEATAKGKHFTKVVFAAQRSGADAPQDYIKLNLGDVLISSYATRGATNTAPIEEFSLNFTKIEMTAIALSGEATNPAIWSLSKNSASYSTGPSIIDKVQAPPVQTALFIKFDGVDGESDVPGHEGEIEVESFSWGMSNPVTSRSSGGGGAGKVSLQDFHFRKTYDKASPKLFEAVATGKHLTGGILKVDKTPVDGAPSSFYQIKLSDVLVSSYQTSGNTGSGVGNDSSLRFGKIEWLTSRPVSPTIGASARDSVFAEFGS